MSGCAIGPNYHQPKTAGDTMPAWSGTGTQRVTHHNATRAWWNEFGDGTLRNLMEELRRNNLDLKSAEARVSRANALSTAESANLYPSPSASGYWSQTQTNLIIPGARPLEVADQFNASTGVTWELDFFGRVRRQVQAASSDAHAAAFDAQDVLAIVSAELGRRYIELRGAQANLQVAQENAKIFRDIVSLNKSLCQGGQISEVELQQSESNLYLIESTIPKYQGQIEIFADQIAVLLGKAPGYRRDELMRAAPMPAMPSMINAGIPSDLLIRRPDVRAAAERLAASTARIGVTEADLLPRFTFNGSVLIDASTFNRLFDGGAGGYSFGPAFSWSGLDFWKVLSQVKAAKANNEELVATYEKTVLEATREVSQQLVEWSRDQETSKELVRAVGSSKEASKLAKDRYEKGLEDFLTVLQAELTRLSAESQLINSEINSRLALIALYRSLGGGWNG